MHLSFGYSASLFKFMKTKLNGFLTFDIFFGTFRSFVKSILVIFCILASIGGGGVKNYATYILD